MLRILARSAPAGAWSAGDFREPRLCWVAERGGEVAGLLLAQSPVPDEAEILMLAVDPESRRQGVARALLRAFLADRIGCVSLEVRASNTAARNLYASAGFTQTAVRRGYYDVPREDAIVMQLVCDKRVNSIAPPGGLC